MSMLIEWAEPPKATVGRGSSTGVPDLVKAAMGQAMTRPGSWAKIVHVDVLDHPELAQAQAHRIREGKVLPGQWDAVSRLGVIFVRFDGWAA